MKKSIKILNYSLLLAITVSTVFLFSGCSTSKDKYTEEVVTMSGSYRTYNNDDELINESDLIIEGQIINTRFEYLDISQHSDLDDEQLNPSGKKDESLLPYTIHEVEIHKTYKGNLEKKDIIEVKQIGGEFEKIKYIEENSPMLKKTKKYILFLKQYENLPYSLLNPVQGSYYSDEINTFRANDGNDININLDKLDSLR